MPRETKFKAWNKKEKVMMSVDAVKFSLSGEVQRVHECTSEISSRVCEKDDVELLQYTGVIDKDGTEIYEGDILDVFEWNNGNQRLIRNVEVAYSEMTASFNLYPNTNTGNDLHHFNEEDIYHVVGNVYEKPELLSQ